MVLVIGVVAGALFYSGALALLRPALLRELSGLVGMLRSRRAELIVTVP